MGDKSFFKNLLTGEQEASIIFTVDARDKLSKRPNISYAKLRKCRNWQTSKTKDLVPAMACGFKSHFPHAEMSELADEQD